MWGETGGRGFKKRCPVSAQGVLTNHRIKPGDGLTTMVFF
jgi:hypothetical protein